MQPAAVIDAGNMDATDVHFALRELGVVPSLDEDHTRLLLDPDTKLSPQLAEAFAANHERLLKQALLSEVLRFVHERIRRREGRSPGDYSVSPAAAATFARMAADEDRISEAFESQGVEGFKDTLRHWGREAIAAYERVRGRDESPVPAGSGSAPGANDETETESVTMPVGPPPLQGTLL